MPILIMRGSAAKLKPLSVPKIIAYYDDLAYCHGEKKMFFSVQVD
ncbi:MAG: hypothetical protein ACJA0E_001261 [Bermanella sp.]|jgi:hypothetical protein